MIAPNIQLHETKRGAVALLEAFAAARQSATQFLASEHGASGASRTNAQVSVHTVSLYCPSAQLCIPPPRLGQNAIFVESLAHRGAITPYSVLGRQQGLTSAVLARF